MAGYSFFRFKKMHHTKFVVKPPARMHIKIGLFCHKDGTPRSTASLPMGSPAAIPNAMHALITPANIATHSPFVKLNSLIVSFFFSSGSSFSLDIPAQPQIAIPIRQTRTPPSVVRPEALVIKSPKVPLYIGGIIVPNAAQNPSAIAYPSDIPRYRIDRPNVRPPMPQSRPKR